MAGLICGSWGALACGFGNLIADLFGTFNGSSVLGFFGNMAGAYLPYRLWHIYSDEQPNLHKNINILKYIFISFLTALSVSWFLGFGLFYFFGTWIEEVYTYVLFNNFGFSVGLGMPLFIMLSSDSVSVACAPRPRKYVILRNEKIGKIIPFIHFADMIVIMICVLVFHESPSDNIMLGILSRQDISEYQTALRGSLQRRTRLPKRKALQNLFPFRDTITLSSVRRNGKCHSFARRTILQ